jgi:hypothetical protein
MKEDIVHQKINRELSNLPIDTEPRVMYLMVEIRKVLEHENDKNGLLYFYCNWVVHTKMNKAFAKEFFDLISPIINGIDIKACRLIDFSELRKEMKLFLEKLNLSIDITNHYNWELFREKLIDILVDTPIENPKAGSFFLQRRNFQGVEFCFKDINNSTMSLGKII